MQAANVIAFIAFSYLITQPFCLLNLKYYQARFLAIVVVGFASYLLAYFMPFSVAFYLSFAALSIAGLVVIAKKRRPFIDRRAESVFLASFAYFLFLRFLLPDIFGAEKLMDVAFINAVLRAENFPPADPFFAGGVLDCYYYFGYVIGAVITLLSFSPPEIGFNIAIAGIAAYSCILVYGFLNELVEERVAIAGVIFVLFSGNLYAAYELMQHAITLTPPGFLYYWNATRVIEDTINEFPYFSFIHADFHAHVVAIPLKILAISLLFDFWRDGRRLTAILIVLLSGVSYLTNSWDAPVLLMLVAGMALRRRECIALFLACIAATAIASTTIHSASAKPLLVDVKSDLAEFLLFFSIQLAFAYYYLREWKLMLASTPAALLAGFFVPIAIPIIPLMVSAAKRIREDFFALLIVSACVIVLAPEFVAIESRLNTVFKLYLAAWIMLTIPGAIALSEVFNNLKSPRGLKKSAILMLILFVMSLVYPVVATPIRHYKAEFTLDGMAFTKAYGEYDAIKWLRERKGVIAEAASQCYSYGGRFAAFTGNPTIVGWACHEVQWRGNGMELAKRMADLRAIYTKPSMELLEEYNVSYVIVGYQERKEYGANPEIFDGMLKRVYECRGVVIFAVGKD